MSGALMWWATAFAWIVAMLVIALAVIAFGSLVILIRRDRG